MATLKDIAEKAGVSIGTVDRIIHNRGRFSTETAEKVRRIIKELDYKPNLLASSLSKNNTSVIAVLIPFAFQDSRYWELLLNGIESAEKEFRPYGVTVVKEFYDRYSRDNFAEALNRLPENLSGIVTVPFYNRLLMDYLYKSDLTAYTVFLDTNIENNNSIPFIGQDSFLSGMLAARLFNYTAGNFDILLILHPDTQNIHIRERIRGFTDFADNDISYKKVKTEPIYDKEDFYRQLDQYSEEYNRIGFFVSDASAHYAAEWAEEKNMRNRTFIVGYDLVPGNIEWVKKGVIDFILTQRPFEQGYRSVNFLFRKIFFKEEIPIKNYTPIDIVVKENIDLFIGEAE